MTTMFSVDNSGPGRVPAFTDALCSRYSSANRIAPPRLAGPAPTNSTSSSSVSRSRGMTVGTPDYNKPVVAWASALLAAFAVTVYLPAGNDFPEYGSTTVSSDDDVLDGTLIGTAMVTGEPFGGITVKLSMPTF